jgi:hypothetical protein
MSTQPQDSRIWSPLNRLVALACLTMILGGALAARQSLSGSPRETVSQVSVDTFPTFERVLLLESTAETSANVALGDVDGDGDLDAVLAKGRHWPLVDRVLLGDGAGHFASGYDLGSASDRTYSGRLVDMDRDGDLDVVISNDAPDPKLVYLNDGKGHFRVGSAYGQASWPTRNATVADLNGDGLPDIVVANRGDVGKTANYICFNKGAARFDSSCVTVSRDPATTITAADFNGDGLIDVAVPHRDGGQSRVYIAGPNANFSAARNIPFGPPNVTIRMTEAADLNGDGLLDIVAIDEERGMEIYLAQRGGTFAPRIAAGEPGSKPYALAVADVNRDSKPDIVVGHIEGPSAVYFNDGSGQRFHSVRFGDSKGTVYGFAVADVDRDGNVDIAVARSEATNVLYFGKQQR